MNDNSAITIYITCMQLANILATFSHCHCRTETANSNSKEYTNQKNQLGHQSESYNTLVLLPLVEGSRIQQREYTSCKNYNCHEFLAADRIRLIIVAFSVTCN